MLSGEWAKVACIVVFSLFWVYPDAYIKSQYTYLQFNQTKNYRLCSLGAPFKLSDCLGIES
jgi:hypothetical protein